ncbi:MAG: hypothetical protein LZF60_420069 [Nitrospira sp.]|nr:MAG: hypothetical protein LZF60_420069 [Nitrospira sp.]
MKAGVGGGGISVSNMTAMPMKRPWIDMEKAQQREARWRCDVSNGRARLMSEPPQD